ncbi:MAG: MTAP family purine nucleoside phosphorylase [Nitrososphaerales archaeon]|jgi:5'-methylthioadenosine phosphorylase
MAVITGSGMHDLFPARGELRVETAYGPATLYRCETASGRGFLFLPRHGPDHSVPPHRINFRANLSALREAGATRVLATSAVGSMTRRLPVGEMGLLDQFIDLSSSRATFFDDRPVHVDMTRPYDRALQREVLGAASALGERRPRTGLVYVSVDGPRYETAAEIRAFRILGGDVVGMTGAPEATLANELGLRYASMVVATNRAAGLQGRVSHDEVVEAMATAAPRVRRLIERTVEAANRI